MKEKDKFLNTNCFKLHLSYNWHFEFLKITINVIKRDKFQNENIDCLFNNFFFRCRRDGHMIPGNIANEM